MQIQATYRDIWKIGYPIMIGNMAHGITQAVDTAFMASVGINDVNATLLAGMTFLFLIIIALGFTRGTQILIARRTGENNYPAVGQVFDQLILKGILLVVFVYVSVLFFNGYALDFMISSDEIFEKASLYLDIRKFSAPVLVLNLILIAFYTGIGRTKVITVSTVILSATNIILDYILIFGHFGAPQMGVEGAALATVLAEVTGTIVLIAALLIRKDIGRFHLFRFPKIEWPLYGKMLELSWPIVFQHVLGLGAWYLFFLMIEKIGEEELAISSVIKSLYMLIGIPIWGLGSAVNTVISNILGQRKIDDVIPAIRKSVVISFVLGAGISFLIFLFPTFFIGLYSREIAVLPEAIPTLNIVLFTMLLFSVGSVAMHAIMGIGDTRTMLLIEVAAIIFYVIFGYSAVFVWKFALPGVWATELVYWTIMPGLAFAYLKWGNWRKIAQKY